MATIIRRKHTSRIYLGPYRRYELLTGEIKYPLYGYDGYGDGVGTDLRAFIDDEMRADWEANCEELLTLWASGEDNSPDGKPWLFVSGSPDTLPWAERQFGDTS
jgi:hypothetical protein